MAVSSPPSRDQVVEHLLKFHSEFRRLFRNHRNLEDRITELDRHPHLTTQEETERKQLQKRKLLEKDRMEQIIRNYVDRGSSAA